MLKNENVSWIVAADGSKLRIFARQDKQEKLILLTILECENARAHDIDLGSKKPHGIFERNKPEAKVELHIRKKVKLAHQIAKLLENGVNAKQFQHLILVATSKFLGALRHSLNKQVPALIIKEIDKDLTNLPEAKLINYLN